MVGQRIYSTKCAVLDGQHVASVCSAKTYSRFDLPQQGQSVNPQGINHALARRSAAHRDQAWVESMEKACGRRDEVLCDLLGIHMDIKALLTRGSEGDIDVDRTAGGT